MRVSGSIHITGDVEGEQVFTTYNKSATKPSKPTGNGEGGGWSVSNEDGAIWMSVKTATDISEGEWGDVIKIKGDQGERGYQGPIPYPAGEWISDVTYTRTTEKVPYVVHDGLYYYLRPEGSVTGGTNPHDDYAANGSNATWILIENMQWLFVEILLAQWAKLGSAIFANDKLISQKGKLNGVDSYDYTEDGFIPIISFNFYDGSGHLAAGNISWDAAGNTEFKGKIDAISGSIGGFEIASGRIGKQESDYGGLYSGLALYNDFIKFSDDNTWVGIGTNVLQATSGTIALGRFENHKQNQYDINLGILINVTNGLYNKAIGGVGDILMEGTVQGYKYYNIVAPVNTVLLLYTSSTNAPDFTKVVVYFNSNSAIELPSRYDIAYRLNINSSTPFAIRMTIICDKSSAYNGTVYGRMSSGTFSSSEYPKLIDNDGAEKPNGYGMGKGDIFEFMLVYNGSSDYSAYILNNRD